jgi:hypothetical protein
MHAWSQKIHAGTGKKLLVPFGEIPFANFQIGAMRKDNTLHNNFGAAINNSRTKLANKQQEKK